MKRIFIGLTGLIFAIDSIGQDLTVKLTVDTLSIIQTVKIPTKEISFGIPNGRLFISKASLIEAWNNELALWEDELKNNPTNKNRQIENYKKSELYLGFVKRQKNLFFEYINEDYDSVSKIPQIEEVRPETDTLYYIENQLKEIACNLLDIGEFEVFVDKQRVDKVIKAKVTRTTKYYETIAIEYIINDSIYFWICPPIIHSDFEIDE
jgi:hypothetical protein